jgi:hypothetical protein
MRLLLFDAIRGGRRLLALSTVLLAIALPGTLWSQTSPATNNYDGHYQLVDPKAARTFSLEVKQTGSRAKISFSAVMGDGSGAAPDGRGQGRVEDGVLSFTFTDNFKNEGTCTLESMSDGYHLSMTVIKVVDPAPFHFYGTILLQKTLDKPR